MLGVEAFKKLVDIEFSSQARIELSDADFDLCPKLLEVVNALKHFQTQLFLSGLRQGGGLCQCKFERFDHGLKIAGKPAISSHVAAIVWERLPLAFPPILPVINA